MPLFNRKKKVKTKTKVKRKAVINKRVGMLNELINDSLHVKLKKK